MARHHQRGKKLAGRELSQFLMMALHFRIKSTCGHDLYEELKFQVGQS